MAEAAIVATVWFVCAWLADQWLGGMFVGEFGEDAWGWWRAPRIVCVGGPISLIAAVLILAGIRYVDKSPYRGMLFQVRRRKRQERVLAALAQ